MKSRCYYTEKEEELKNKQQVLEALKERDLEQQAKERELEAKERELNEKERALKAQMEKQEETTKNNEKTE